MRGESNRCGFPTYIVLSTAVMWLFSERLNFFLNARSHDTQESAVSPQESTS